MTFEPKIRRAFIDEETCFNIILKNYQHVRAAPVNDRGIVKELRNSSWYNYKEEELISKLYEISDKDELIGLESNLALQFSEYKVGQCFHWHNDKSKIRSHIILLNNDFTGGELEFEGLNDLKLNIGDCITYDSNINHRVKKVISGARYSLVAWAYDDDKIWQTDERFK